MNKGSHRLGFFIMTLGLLVCLSGCDNLNVTKEKPCLESLAGNWQMTPYSPEWIRSAGLPVPVGISLDLRADGTFTASHMPAWWATHASRPLDEILQGQWAVVRKENAYWVVQLEFTGPKTQEILILRGEGPYLLHQFVSDPDEGKAMVLEKTPKNLRAEQKP